METPSNTIAINNERNSASEIESSPTSLPDLGSHVCSGDVDKSDIKEDSYIIAKSDRPVSEQTTRAVFNEDKPEEGQVKKSGGIPVLAKNYSNSRATIDGRSKVHYLQTYTLVF